MSVVHILGIDQNTLTAVAIILLVFAVFWMILNIRKGNKTPSETDHEEISPMEIDNALLDNLPVDKPTTIVIHPDETASNYGTTPDSGQGAIESQHTELTSLDEEQDLANPNECVEAIPATAVPETAVQETPAPVTPVPETPAPAASTKKAPKSGKKTETAAKEPKKPAVKKTAKTSRVKKTVTPAKKPAVKTKKRETVAKPADNTVTRKPSKKAK